MRDRSLWIVIANLDGFCFLWSITSTLAYCYLGRIFQFRGYKTSQYYLAWKFCRHDGCCLWTLLEMFSNISTSQNSSGREVLRTTFRWWRDFHLSWRTNVWRSPPGYFIFVSWPWIGSRTLMSKQLRAVYETYGSKTCPRNQLTGHSFAPVRRLQYSRMVLTALWVIPFEWRFWVRPLNQAPYFGVYSWIISSPQRI